MKQPSEQGYTLSREASSATFQSAAMMTPSSAVVSGVRRSFSGQLPQAATPQFQLTPGGGVIGSSGSGVRYPAELANMPSAIGGFGSQVMSQPRLGVTNPSMQWGSPRGSQM